jgi:C-terminal processing protease CtpA/Prc
MATFIRRKNQSAIHRGRSHNSRGGRKLPSRTVLTFFFLFVIVFTWKKDNGQFLLLSESFIILRSYSQSSPCQITPPKNFPTVISHHQRGKRRCNINHRELRLHLHPKNGGDDNDNDDDDAKDGMLYLHRLRTIGIASILATTLWMFGGFSPISPSSIAFAAASSSDITTTSSIATTTTRSSGMPVGQKYWSIMSSANNNNDNNNSNNEIQEANKVLIDYAIGTINSQYYDNSGGYNFTPSDFYKQWKDIQKRQTQTQAKVSGEQSQTASASASASLSSVTNNDALRFDTRDDTVHTLKYLVSTLKDPYSKYMTRDELRYELKGSGHDGFLGTGCYVEVPKSSTTASTSSTSSTKSSTSQEESSTTLIMKKSYYEKKKSSSSNKHSNSNELLTTTRVSNLPVVTAVAPNSPAERAGIVVGDRVVGIGDRDNFIGWTKFEILNYLQQKGYDKHEYFGVADLTIAKPVYYTAFLEEENEHNNESYPTSTTTTFNNNSREIVMGYRSTKVKIPTKAMEPSPSINTHLQGDSVVQYELLTSSSSSSSLLPTSSSSLTSLGGGESASDSATSSTSSIFDTGRLTNAVSSNSENNENNNNNNKVGYIRLTRFSKLSTKGYINAISSLENDGASSYIIDLRNNYGGVIQEAMLVASSLLDDPHAILCYLLNARGGFTPVDVEQYVIDSRYPGYFLSSEISNDSKLSVLKQVQKEHPNMFHYTTVLTEAASAAETGTGTNNNGAVMIGKRLLVADNWDPPSSYASIHEQVVKRGIHRVSYDVSNNNNENNSNNNLLQQQQQQQQQRKRNNVHQHYQKKDIVLLINEGTASSAEFFVAALKDNNRCAAVIGTKSFGKGLIQHTFPMPDGGGLKLTIGEFLRPSLQHVTNISFYDHPNTSTGSSSELMGGIRPDVYCDSKQGIPGKPQSDLCVSVALDVLEEERTTVTSTSTSTSTATATTTTKWNFAHGPDV